MLTEAHRGIWLGRHADPDLVDPPGRGRRCGGGRHRVPRPGFDRRRGGDRVLPGRRGARPRRSAPLPVARCSSWPGATVRPRSARRRPPTTSRPGGCWSRPASRRAMTASSRYVDDRRCGAMTGGQGSTRELRLGPPEQPRADPVPAPPRTRRPDPPQARAAVVPGDPDSGRAGAGEDPAGRRGGHRPSLGRRCGLGAGAPAATGRRGRRPGWIRSVAAACVRWWRRSVVGPAIGSGASDAAFEALAPACLEQVVTGKEAYRAWRLLVGTVRGAGARTGARTRTRRRTG